jgi:hypothetical protein
LSRRSRENYRDYFILDESKMDSGSLQNYSLLDTVQDGETTYGIYARQNQLNHPFKNLTKRRGISTIQLDMPRCFVTDLSFFTFFVACLPYRQGVGLPALRHYAWRFLSKRILSEIMAINSLFVGLPRRLWIV